jgi:hypothetical protein
MHHFIKLTPLLLGAVSMSACSALGLGQAKSTAHSAVSGQYVQTAANTHANTMTDYHVNSGWYAKPEINPYAGGDVQLDIQPTEIYPAGKTQMAHNGYHDQYGNPVPAPAQGGYNGPANTTYVTPSLRGSYGPSYYGNIGAVMYDVDDEVFGLVGRLGVQKEWYGAEVEGSVGVIDEDIGGVDLGVDYSLAAFGVGRLPVGERFNALARIGYAGDGVTVSANEDFDGIAYGAGLEYDLNAVSGLRFDYTRYDLGEATSDTLAATYLRRF